jgi:hypothetical protein
MTSSIFEIEAVEVADPTDEGDHDKFAHYVPKDKLADAMVFGTPLRALCGKMWVPTRDGLKFPVCPECKEKYEQFPEG